jgi:hypothetical protein
MSAALQGLNDLYLQQGTQVPIQELPRKTPGRQSSNIFEINQALALFEQIHERMHRDIEELRMRYVFADETVSQFLYQHRAFPSVLSDALRPLRHFFGDDKIFRLEVSTDEDELRTFYVVVRWTGSAEDAAAAIDRFDDQWWLEHMTPAVSNLSFTYEFA